MGDITAGVFAADKQMSRKFLLSCKETFPEDLFAMNGCLSLLVCKLFSFTQISTALCRCSLTDVQISWCYSLHPLMAVLQLRGWFAEPCLQVQDCLLAHKRAPKLNLSNASIRLPTKQQAARCRAALLVPHWDMLRRHAAKSSHSAWPQGLFSDLFSFWYSKEFKNSLLACLFWERLCRSGLHRYLREVVKGSGQDSVGLFPCKNCWPPNGAGRSQVRKGSEGLQATSSVRLGSYFQKHPRGCQNFKRDSRKYPEGRSLEGC